MTPSSENGSHPKELSTALDIIEFLLRWASIAYAAGFLTVMVNTAALGIPVLQLIEPVLVWIGLPLAIVIWAVMQTRHLARRYRDRLTERLEKREEQFKRVETLSASGQVTEAFALVVSITIREALDITLSGAPLDRAQELSVDIVRKALQKLSAPNEANGADKDKGKASLRTAIKWMALSTKWTGRLVTALTAATHLILFIALIVAIVGGYVFFIYPKIPQKWGGGHAVEVRLILAEDKFPAGDLRLQKLFGETTNKGTSLTGEPRVTEQVDLLYATEHAYFVRPSGGPILQLSSDAISGVIY
jgi:hypothetical protein